jgi:DNA-binding transcriptional regulator LsrR (DeoR family)
MQLQYYVALVIQFTAEIGGFDGRRHIIVFTTYQQDLTMKEIAARLEVDESRVSQLHAEALRRLKARVRAFLYPSKEVALAVASSPGLAACQVNRELAATAR